MVFLKYVSPLVACSFVLALSVSACSSGEAGGGLASGAEGVEAGEDAEGEPRREGGSSEGNTGGVDRGTDEVDGADGGAASDEGDESGEGDATGPDDVNTEGGDLGPPGDDISIGGGGGELSDTSAPTDAGEEASDVADVEGPVEPEQAGHPGFEMMLKIASPGAGLGAQVIGAKTTVAGILFGDADTITWTATGQGVPETSGEIIPGAFWVSGPISLAEGDNQVTVTATLGDVIATDTITITYNPVFRFDERPLARPPIVWSGASTPVVFTIPVSLYPNFDADTVSLLEVDSMGVELANLGQMLDNGATASVGDEIESDGVFTKKVTLNCSGGVDKHYRVSVQARKGQEWYTAYSPKITVACVEHYTAATCQTDFAVIQQAQQLADSGGTTEEVVTALVNNEASRALDGPMARATRLGFASRAACSVQF